MPLLPPPAAPMATFRELHTLFRSSQRARIYSEISAAPIHADPRLVAVTEMRYVPVLRGKRYANYLWLDPVFQFQAILLPSRARSTNCSSARPEDVCSPGSSRLAPGLDVLRHRAGVLRERRLPRSDLPHEVHRIWNHFPSASVYQKTLTQKRGCRIFLSVAKEKGEYLDQPRIRRICVIASLLDVITSRHEGKFVD